MEFFLILFLFVFLIFCVSFSIISLYHILLSWLLPIFLGGAFFAKSREELVEKMIYLADIRPGEKAVDLGSGDGRLVIALAKAGAEAYGYEINPFLVWFSRRNIKKAGLIDKAFICWGNFWNEDFSKFNIVTIYGITYMMKRLEIKLKKELRPDSRIISNYFIFQNWTPHKTKGAIRLYKV